MVEGNTYDVAGIRVKAIDEYGNVLPYYQEALELSVEGSICLIGPNVVPLRGGMSGTYVKTLGVEGKARLIIKCHDIEKIVDFNIRKEKEND